MELRMSSKERERLKVMATLSEGRLKHRQWRQRRECFGEMVQLDASPHAWFEGRAKAEPVLLTLIDDATGKRRHRFYEAEGTAPTMDLVARWLRRYGRMLAIYGDKAGYLVVNRPPQAEEALAGREAETQVGRALRELGIDYIPGRSAGSRTNRSCFFSVEASYWYLKSPAPLPGKAKWEVSDNRKESRHAVGIQSGVGPGVGDGYRAAVGCGSD